MKRRKLRKALKRMRKRARSIEAIADYKMACHDYTGSHAYGFAAGRRDVAREWIAVLDAELAKLKGGA